MDMIAPFNFQLSTDVRFGAGAAARLPEWIEAAGWKRLALVLDAGACANPCWKAIEAQLAQRFAVVARLETDVREPSYDFLDEARREFSGKAIDVFIALGGGSVLDLGKALSLLLTNPKPAIEYRGFNLPKQPGPPLIAIPTTAGSGSEVTPNAVFTDTTERRKFGINTALYLPKFCVLDPELTTTCPRSATVSSGMDALVHTHESFVSRNASPITRMFSVAAFELLFNHLARAVEAPDDVAARGCVLLGSYLAGTALFNSSAGPCGGLSYPLGVHYGVPHGLAGAAFLPHIVAHNVAAGYTDYHLLYARIHDAEPAPDAAEASRRFAARIKALCAAVGVPDQLEGFRFRRADLPAFMEHVRKLQPAFDFNPVPFDAAAAQRILEQMTTSSAAASA
jgi:alcohol dehydrogenase class IV